MIIKLLKKINDARLNYFRNKDSQKNTKENNGYKLYQYKDRADNFDYNKYQQAQIAANKGKLHKVWATQENIKFLADWLITEIQNIDFGICHGTRRGEEQKWFKEKLNCQVVGTEISDTASQFPDTIQWDFHEVKPEWVGKADFIYSNSFDHSYNPQKCLQAWMSCLKPNGICIIEHSNDDYDASKVDPFGARLEMLPYLILKWGQGKFSVKKIIKAPKQVKDDRNFDIYFLIIQNN